MSEFLPAPLVPAEVDLRGLEYMPLLGDRLFASDFDLDANDTEFRIGLKLWWAAWKQVPAGSLPKEDSRLCKLAGLGEAPAKWRKVRDRALHGFIECSDGRLYHPVVAKQALIAWEKRVEDRAEKEGDADRKAREREQRASMFRELKEAGITPKWNTPTTELRRLHAEHVTRTGPPEVTEPVTVTVTAKTGRDGTGRSTPPIKDGEFSTTAAPGATDPPAQPDDPEPPPAPSLAGRACLACRGANVHDVNPSHPDLLRLLAAGVTPEEIGATAAECAGKGKARFAYVLATVERRRSEAAARPVAPAAGPVDPMAWAQLRSEVVGMGCRLGLGPFEEVDHATGRAGNWTAYRTRVIAAWREQQQPQGAAA